MSLWIWFVSCVLTLTNSGPVLVLYTSAVLLLLQERRTQHLKHANLNMRMRHATAVASVVVLLYCIVPVAEAVVFDIFEYSIYDTLLRCLTAHLALPRSEKKATLTADGVEVSLPQTNSARIAYLHHKLLLVCRGGRVRLLLEGS